MKSFNIKKFLVPALLVLAATQSVAYDGISFIRQNGKTKVNVPINGADAPSVIMSERGGAMFFATGQAATNLSRANQAVQDIPSPVQPQLEVQFSELLLITDYNNKTIAAAYPIKPVIDLHITALHTLKASRINGSTARIWGLQNIETNEVYDVAVISERLSKELVEVTLKSQISTSSIKDIVSFHLNMVDKGRELALSKSTAVISANNNDYFFFLNSNQSFVGPSSSGALIYAGNAARGIVLCTSKLINSENTHMIRALDLKVLNKSRLIELSPDLIESFKPLDCDNHDARRGGGD